MKKLLTLLATLAVAMTLSMPVFAQETGSQETQTTTTHKASKKKASKKHKKSKKQQKSEQGGTGESQ